MQNGSSNANSFGGSGSFGEMLADWVEDAVVVVIESVRERPAVAAAQRPKRRAPEPERLARQGASAFGDMLASMASAMADAGNPRDAAKSARKAAKRSRFMDRLGDLGDARDLAGLALGLLENPIVRAYLRSFVLKQVKRRFGD